MARIWRGGCIIRARFLNRITEAYERNPDLPLLLADDYFSEAVGNSLAAWRRVVSAAAQNGFRHRRSHPRWPTTTAFVQNGCRLP